MGVGVVQALVLREDQSPASSRREYEKCEMCDGRASVSLNKFHLHWLVTAKPLKIDTLLLALLFVLLTSCCI